MRLEIETDTPLLQIGTKLSLFSLLSSLFSLLSSQRPWLRSGKSPLSRICFAVRGAAKHRLWSRRNLISNALFNITSAYEWIYFVLSLHEFIYLTQTRLHEANHMLVKWLLDEHSVSVFKCNSGKTGGKRYLYYKVNITVSNSEFRTFLKTKSDLLVQISCRHISGVFAPKNIVEELFQ